MLSNEELQLCKDYFTVHYGVKEPSKPREAKKHSWKIWLLMFITVIPFIISMVLRAKNKAAWAAYDNEVNSRRNNYPAKFKDICNRYIDKDELLKKALSKSNVDASEIEAFKPILFRGQNFRASAYTRGNDACIQTYNYVLLTEQQIIVYELSYDFYAQGAVKERTTEYFYKDVTNFKSDTVTVENRTNKDKSIETNAFVIIVPGDSYTLELYGGNQDEIDEQIKALKGLLRQKKM